MQFDYDHITLAVEGQLALAGHVRCDRGLLRGTHLRLSSHLNENKSSTQWITGDVFEKQRNSMGTCHDVSNSKIAVFLNCGSQDEE